MPAPVAAVRPDDDVIARDRGPRREARDEARRGGFAPRNARVG
jgi:hypothetical protein